MATAVKKIEATPITPIVREVWQRNEGDMPGAVEALYGAVIGDKTLIAEIMPSVLRTWCRERIGDYVGSLRLAAITPANDSPQGNRLRTAITATLFDFPLPGGKRLGDANASEIREGAQKYGQTASDAAHKARWLAMVADKVGRKNRAQNALTLDQIEALFEEARDAE